MRWLKRLLGAQAAAAPEPPDSGGWLRDGYDCASRGDLAGAEQLIRRLLAHDPAHADAYYYLGRIAVSGRREEEAIDLLQKAVELRPGEAIYLETLGDVLLLAKRYGEAVEVLRAGVALLPDATAMRLSYVVALVEDNRRDTALAELQSLLDVLPDSYEVHFNLGGIHREFGRPDEAIASYRRALASKPDDARAFSNLLLQLNYSASVDAAAIYADHLRFGAQFAQRYITPAPDPAWPRKLRVGYLSPDFCDHVVMRFVEPILVRHDRARFEIFCYHSGPRKDAVTERLRGLVENWIDCEEYSDAQLAGRIRADRIDILVDLAGHMARNSLTAMAMKPAPIQATYLGYPNTTGLAAVDYRISDAYADPPGESDRLSVERLMRLPGSYFCYRPGPEAPAVGPLPALQAGYVTFGCFNHFSKASAPFLAMAARVLGAVPNSRLLLKARPLSIESVARTVRDGFERAGIDPSRTQLRGWEAGNQDHLAAYGSVDIALDSFPYNGATTTCEALWMGVPVVSLAGDRHAGRAGSSLLNAVGLGGHVTRDPAEYLAICARLAGDVEKLALLRTGLRERVRRSPLMDEAGFTLGLERCYVDMWEDMRRAAAVPESAARGQSAEDHHMLGCSLQEQGRIDDAIGSFRRAIELDPAFAKAHNNLGCLLEAAGSLDEAAQCYREAARIDPKLAHAWYNLGNACKQLGDAQQAITHVEQSLAIEPGHADWRCNLGNLQYDQLRLDEAISSFQASIALDPGYDRACVNLGAAMVLTGRIEEADTVLRKALERKPDPAIESRLLLLRHFRAKEDAEALFEEHRSWADRHARRLVRSTDQRARAPAPGRRINIGYVSPDFGRGPLANFIESVLAEHDRGAFNVFCYSSAGREDEVTLRIRGLSTHWRDISRLSDADAADRVRTDGIDVLVDLAGHGEGGRLLLFARKPAPVQVTWLGYPGTTGLSTMDYRLSDGTLDPPGQTEHTHTEKLFRLPKGSLCYAPPKESPDAGDTSEAGVGKVTFGCFNSLAKVTPDMIALWAELLRGLPNARLIVKSRGLGAQSARRELRDRFLGHGIDGDRVELRAGTPHFEHLSGYREVDVALDVFPCNGMSATCEALWMGVPVVTLSGTMRGPTASRLGASILASAGFAEFVADTPERYLDIARRLAGDSARRRAWRTGMRSHLRSSPLFDAPRMARDLEGAYRKMLDPA